MPEGGSIDPRPGRVRAGPPRSNLGVVVVNPPNLPGWSNLRLAAEHAKTYSVPVRVDSDASAAPYARFGVDAGIAGGAALR